MAYPAHLDHTSINAFMQSICRYELVHQLTVGGMAEVYLARAHGAAGFYRYVAVKWLRPDFADDPEFVGMLIDEALVASRLHHAGISTILDLGSCDGRYYIVEEYVHGRDLRHVLQRCARTHRSLPTGLVCYILVKLCDALDYAHDATDWDGRPLELVHRDVSPPNVIVSYEGSVKLIDFGIARSMINSTMTQAGHIKGKLAYMAPEQLRGQDLDRRADVFALGIILYELLTTRPLFRASDRSFATEQELVVRLRELTHDSRLRRIVSTALAWEPAFRYQSAAELREALMAYAYQEGQRGSRGELSRWLQRCFRDAPDIHDPTASHRHLSFVAPKRLRAWKNRPHTRVALPATREYTSLPPEIRSVSAASQM